MLLLDKAGTGASYSGYAFVMKLTVTSIAHSVSTSVLADWFFQLKSPLPSGLKKHLQVFEDNSILLVSLVDDLYAWWSFFRFGAGDKIPIELNTFNYLRNNGEGEVS